MADFAPAIAKTLAHEGGYAYFPKTGEVANRGITVWLLRDIGALPKKDRAIPASAEEIAYVKALTLDATKAIYEAHFWNKNKCGQIADQALAEKFFDLSVNMGPGAAAKLLQFAVNRINWPSPQIVEDGIVGPKTIATVNDAIAEDVLDQLKMAAETRYRKIAANPIQAGNLDGWLARLNA